MIENSIVPSGLLRRALEGGRDEDSYWANYQKFIKWHSENFERVGNIRAAASEINEVLVAAERDFADLETKLAAARSKIQEYQLKKVNIRKKMHRFKKIMENKTFISFNK
jgi:predicted  nucleic acid-binding Zn-ribbon protein